MGWPIAEVSPTGACTPVSVYNDEPAAITISPRVCRLGVGTLPTKTCAN